jgi:hypothetical protein
MLAVVAGTGSPLRAVEIVKDGYSCTIDDCYVESARVATSDRARTRTIAVKMADPERVMQVVTSLGLADRTPLSFTAAPGPPCDTLARQ